MDFSRAFVSLGFCIGKRVLVYSDDPRISLLFQNKTGVIIREMDGTSIYGPGWYIRLDTGEYQTYSERFLRLI